MAELENAEKPGWTDPGFERIYQEHSQAVYYLTLRFLGDPAKAEDATHDIFLKAFQKIGEFRGDSSLRTWLYRIAHNHCLNIRQSWHHRNMMPMEDVLLEGTGSREPNPLRVLETKELGQRIQATLDILPNEYKLLLLLVADEQLSYEDIGSLTGQTGDAIRGKLHRARKMFHFHFQRTA